MFAYEEKNAFVKYLCSSDNLYQCTDKTKEMSAKLTFFVSNEGNFVSAISVLCVFIWLP